MRLIDLITEQYLRPFNVNTTDMPHYDQMLTNPEYFEKEKGVSSRVVRSFPPDHYIAKCAKAWHTTPDKLLKDRNQEDINKYAELMKSGTKFPLPVIDYSRGFSQEGLHRAFAAKMMGVDKMPYLQVTQSNK